MVNAIITMPHELISNYESKNEKVQKSGTPRSRTPISRQSNPGVISVILKFLPVIITINLIDIPDSFFIFQLQIYTIKRIKEKEKVKVKVKSAFLLFNILLYNLNTF